MGGGTIAGDPSASASPSLAGMAIGHRFPPATFTADEQTVAAYRVAIDDTQPDGGAAGRGHGGATILPPVAVAALALRRLAGELALQPGSVHLGQEYEFHRRVHVGEELVVHSQIVRRSRRRGAIILVIEQNVRCGETTVLSGRSTISVPDSGGPEGGDE